MARAPAFRLAGIPVRIEPAFLIIIAILGIDPNDPQPKFIVSWVLIATISILVHEFGHAIAFRSFGISPSIVLQGFGGLTSGSGELSPARHITVSLAGPFAALVLLGAPSWWLLANADVTGDARVILAQVVWINIGWSVLNLLPILPLDGGQVFLGVLDWTTHGRGRRAAEIVSVVVAVVLGVLSWRAGFTFGALLAAMFAGLNLSSLSRVKAVELGDQLAAAHRALLEHRPAEAEQVATAVLAKRPSGATLQWASELLGWARLWQGDLAGAEQVVARFAHAGGASGSFRGAQALAAGRTAEGVAVLAWAFANEPPGPSKSLGAVAAAGSGQAEAVARELLLLDDGAGVEPARLLQGLLAYAGYHDAAASVARLLPAGA